MANHDPCNQCRKDGAEDPKGSKDDDKRAPTTTREELTEIGEDDRKRSSNSEGERGGRKEQEGVRGREGGEEGREGREGRRGGSERKGGKEGERGGSERKGGWGGREGERGGSEREEESHHSPDSTEEPEEQEHRVVGRES